MIKWSIHQEDKSTRNVQTLDDAAANYMKQKIIELKEEADKSTIIFKELNTALSIIIEQLEYPQGYRRIQEHYQPTESNPHL